MAGEGSVALVVELDRFIQLIPVGAPILAKDFRDVSEEFSLAVDGASLVLAEMESQARSEEDHAAVLGGSQRFRGHVGTDGEGEAVSGPQKVGCNFIKVKQYTWFVIPLRVLYFKRSIVGSHR